MTDRSNSESESESEMTNDCGEHLDAVVTRMYSFHVGAQRTAMRRAQLLRLKLMLLVSCQRESIVINTSFHRVRDIIERNTRPVGQKMGCPLHPSTSALSRHRAGWRTRRNCRPANRQTMDHLYARARTNIIFILRYVAQESS